MMVDLNMVSLTAPIKEDTEYKGNFGAFNDFDFCIRFFNAIVDNFLKYTHF